MKKLGILFLLAAFFSGCDIECVPYGSYSADKIQSDPESAFEILLNGCYDQLKSATDVMHRTGEYPGDNMMKQASTTNPFYMYMSYRHTPNNYYLNTTWVNAYKIISQSSDLVKLVEEGTSPEVDQKLGEAYFMRGMMYFYLCRIFGRPYYQSPETNLGVPLVNGMPSDLQAGLPDRSTVKETYAQVIHDLRKAETLMTQPRKSAIYISKTAAQALLAKVYAYMSGTYENPDPVYTDSCFYYADQVIRNKEEAGLALLNRSTFMKYNEYVPESGAQTETILAVKRLDAEFDANNPYVRSIGSMYAQIEGVGWGEIYASAKFIDLLNETGTNDWVNRQFTDARAAFIHPQYATDSDGKLIRAFRCVRESYDESGRLSRYVYLQAPIEGTEDAPFIQYNGQTYPLTVVDADNRKMSVELNGKTYVGYDDYQVRLNNGYPMFYIYKCSLEDGIPQLHSPIISRLAEMYLLRAEACAKKGNYQQARLDVNEVRERSIPGKGYGASEFTATTAKELIMKERQLELAFEADRGFDVFRVGGTMVRRYPGFYNTIFEVGPDDPAVVQLIPQDQINAYTGVLTQNPY